MAQNKFSQSCGFDAVVQKHKPVAGTQLRYVLVEHEDMFLRGN